MTALLVATAALGCYVLLAQGWRATRSTPTTSLGDDHLPLRGERTSVLRALGQRAEVTLGPSAAAALGPRYRTRAARRLGVAGHSGISATDFAGRQALFAGLGLVTAVYFLGLGLPALSVLGLAVAAMPEVALHTAIQQRQRQIEAELPDFLDLLSVTVSAGVSFRPALERVASTAVGALGEESQATLRELAYGVSRREAFQNLRDRNPGAPTMSMFVTAILQAEELGAPLSTTLQQLAADMRRELSQTVRRRAARAIPRVSLIITMVLLPAVILLVLVALFLGSDIDLGGI